MANILCYVELVTSASGGHEPTPSSLEVLGQGRRLGSALGATVYVAVAMPQAPGYGNDDVLAKLATGGADKVLLLVGDAFARPTVETTLESHGTAIALAWDVCQPAIVLMPSTSAGRELAARTAARAGAAFLHDAFVEMVDNQLVLAERSRGHARCLHAELEFPVVATIPPGRYAQAAGDEEAEVEVLQASGVSRFLAEDAAAVRPAPLRATVAVPDSFGALPPGLANAERIVATPAWIELTTGRGPLRIALGDRAEDEQADFAVKSPPSEVLARWFGRAVNQGPST